MHFRARDHVTELTGLLSVVSLALVFGAATGAIPSNTIPRAPDRFVAAIPHVNAVISVVAVAVIAFGWQQIRAGNVDRHRVAMVAGFVLFALFLALYLYKVALEGPKPFPDHAPAAVYTYVYLPTLVVHVALAVICIPLLFYVLLVGVTHDVSEIPRTRHRGVGRVAAPLWLVSFALGTVVYLMLYVVY
jgi:putative membrane protein